jgi:mRNA interferase MazF
VFVVVSRQALIRANVSTVICAPIYSAYHGISTQVAVGPDEGLKHLSSIHCDELVSLPKSMLTNFVGSLPVDKVKQLDVALARALELPF